MASRSSQLSVGALTPVAAGYAAVGAGLLGVLVVASTAALSPAVTVLLTVGTFFVGGFTAFNQLFPFALSHFERQSATAACKETVRRPQWVTFDLSRRERVLGWGSAGVATASVVALVPLLLP